MVLQSTQTSRRRALQTIAIALATTAAPVKAEIDFRLMTTPDQTLEEAEDGIKFHAQSLLQVKDLLLEVETLREAQKALRKSSSYLKQDMYTIINSKPGNERTLLRKLYFNLFNSVTRLDYAARDNDLVLVNECYDNVVVALNNIMSKI
ncbi:hypothetical protein LIER_28838 [Lithospermum erythrorhizon]|uniref:PsbQ-like protein 3, chloroplastic n=1 Tax=Lithospermum erythrorhizon TaxID=34254 RepID=A0AAV3RH53_LITER